MKERFKRWWKGFIDFMVEAGNGVWEATKNGNYPYL